MTTTTPPATSTATLKTKPATGSRISRMSPMRKVALAGGIAYLVSFAASIPQLKLFAGLIDDPSGFIGGTGSNTSVLWGSWLEVITAASCIATAVALYPATRRVSRTAAIGFVTTRVVEATLIMVGVLGILSVVTLKANFAGATGNEADALHMAGETLVAMRQWTFLLGPGLIVGFNALFLGYVMYRGRLVPRIIPTLGLIGAPLMFLSATATIFGVWEQSSVPSALCTVPVFIWELSLGIYLTFKGFKKSPEDIAPV